MSAVDRPSGPASHRALLAALRQATAEAHQRLDRSVSAWGLSSRAGYVAMLRASAAVLGPIERVLVDYPFFSGCDRLARIEHDLGVLGARPPPPATLSFLPYQTDASALGAAYVVEGSALGGLVMARSVEQKLGIDPKATTYLRGRGAETGAHWSAFLERLDTLGRRFTDDDRARATASAVSAFAAFAAVFEESQPR